MPIPPRVRLLSLLPRFGLQSRTLKAGAALVSTPDTRLFVHCLDDRTWVVQHGGRPKNLTVQPVEDGLWLVQRGPGRRRKLRRMGTPEARTHLLVDEQAGAIGGPASPADAAAALPGRGASRLDSAGSAGELRPRRGRQHRPVRAPAAQAGYAGRIVSFEPLPHLHAELLERTADDPDWQVMPYALGDESTEAEMTVVADRGKTSSLLPASGFGKQWLPRLEGIRKQVVQIRRLEEVFDDAVAGLADPRVFLKLDTQGYDLRAFTGAGDRTKEVLGLQSEISAVPIYDGMPHMTESIAAYEAAGFATSGVFPVTRDGGRHRVIEFDIVMVRPEAVPSAEDQTDLQ